MTFTRETKEERRKREVRAHQLAAEVMGVEFIPATSQSRAEIDALKRGLSGQLSEFQSGDYCYGVLNCGDDPGWGIKGELHDEYAKRQSKFKSALKPPQPR